MIQYLTGNTHSKLLKGWTTSPTFYTGVDIITQNVFAVTSGVVLFIGNRVDGYQNVIIQYDTYTCLCYGHLSSVDVHIGQIVQRSDRVGNAYKYVHFEYITTTQESVNDQAVRIGTKTYYKHNPTPVLEGVITLDPDAGKETELFTIDPNIQTLFEE